MEKFWKKFLKKFSEKSFRKKFSKTFFVFSEKKFPRKNLRWNSPWRHLDTWWPPFLCLFKLKSRTQSSSYTTDIIAIKCIMSFFKDIIKKIWLLDREDTCLLLFLRQIPSLYLQPATCRLQYEYNILCIFYKRIILFERRCLARWPPIRKATLQSLHLKGREAVSMPPEELLTCVWLPSYKKDVHMLECGSTRVLICIRRYFKLCSHDVYKTFICFWLWIVVYE